MEDQKHYVMVDNETYELHDGNGSFYVTKASQAADRFSLQNSLCPLKDPSSSFLSNLALSGAVNNSNINCQTVQPLEPIIINDYGNMNYFTQAASDVTIYLNPESEINFTESSYGQYAYVTNADGIIDLTKMSKGSPRMCNSSERRASIDLNRTLDSILSDEVDAPEYIDISKLKLTLSPEEELVLSKSPKANNSKSTEGDCTNEGDDEVIFVKEFSANDKENNTTKPLDLRRESGLLQNVAPQPRRNPRRQVQLLKQSHDLAVKLSDEDIFCGKRKRFGRSCSMENSRKSGSDTIATTSSVATFNKYKEWPAEGLHEKPVFNMATKKIEKFDNKSPEEKCNTPVKKNGANAVKPVKGKKPGKKGRKAPNKVKKPKESPEKGISKEFALLTHETLQDVINYVAQVKEYNSIREGKINGEEVQVKTGSLMIDAQTVLNLVRSDDMKGNLTDAVDLLTDSCLLYCLANDVCQGSVATYLNSRKGK